MSLPPEVQADVKTKLCAQRGSSTLQVLLSIWGFPKIRGTILGVPIIWTIVFWGLYWGPLILGNYHILNHKGPSTQTMGL